MAFRISYGFLLWVIGPVTMSQIILNHPLATGRAAKDLFGAQVFFGLVLGVLFPYVHSLLQARVLGTSGSRSELVQKVGDKEIREHGKPLLEADAQRE